MKKQNYQGSGKIPLPDSGKSFSYIPDSGLKEAVNVGLLLGRRPILLTGEPGVGKTLLAKALAWEWYPDGIDGHYFEWNIKSTSKAQDGLYRYDALRRLADVQLLKSGAAVDVDQINNTTLGKKGSYYEFGKLSEAVQSSTKGKKSILLIDEIDKADIDFPNDLLHELDKFEFTIPETGEYVQKPENFDFPLIIITSNQEKELPPAFLRRCIYYHIDFPNLNQLTAILASYFSNSSSEYLEIAVELFYVIRNHISKRQSGIEKKISTSELIDWYQTIDIIIAEQASNSVNQDLFSKLQLWFNDYKVKRQEYMAKVKGDEDQLRGLLNQSPIFSEIPFYHLLFKNIATQKLFSEWKK